MKPIRVLYLDDEERWRKMVSQGLQREGFTVDVCENRHEAEILLTRGFYHILVLDICMDSHDNENDVGMSFLEELSRDGLTQTAVVVMLTAFGKMNQMQTAFRDFGVKDFCSKHHFNHVAFAKELRGLFEKEMPINLDLTFHWQGVENPKQLLVGKNIGGTWIKKKEGPFLEQLGLELEDVLARLFAAEETIYISPMQQGGGGSGVLLVQPGRGGSQPVVVKFGDAADIKTEKENFEMYAEPYLKASRSGKLMGYARVSRLAGICYAFLGTDQFQSFGDFHKKADTNNLCLVLDHLFLQTCAPWYANTGGLEPLNLVDLYRRLTFFDDDKLNRTIKKHLPSAKLRNDLRFDNLERSFMDPVKAARDLGSFFPKTYRCITHGDLNPDNIFVGKNLGVWLIDFLSTGQSHILRDFAQLEVHLKMTLLAPEQANLKERLLLEEALQAFECSGEEPVLDSLNPVLLKTYRVCLHLRRLAWHQLERNPDRSFKEYQLPLLFFSLNQCRYVQLPAIQREHGLLAAALNCERFLD